MSQPIHTPGPVRVFSPFGRPEIVTGRPTAHETQSVVVQFGEPGAASNARLIAAAYNAFDAAARRLGCNAVELAERMADGGIAELAEALLEYTQRHEGEGDPTGLPEYEKAIAAIAKVKRGAA